MRVCVRGSRRANVSVGRAEQRNSGDLWSSTGHNQTTKAISSSILEAIMIIYHITAISFDKCEVAEYNRFISPAVDNHNFKSNAMD